MSFFVRPIVVSDYTQTIEMIKRTIMISQKDIYSKKLQEEFCKKYTFENFVNKATQIDYFVAVDVDTNNVSGIIGLKGDELRTFFVDPSQQGKGIGRNLYTYLEGKAKEKGIKKLKVEGGQIGELIYYRFGFIKKKTIKKEQNGISFEDAYMEKELK